MNYADVAKVVRDKWVEAGQLQWAWSRDEIILETVESLDLKEYLRDNLDDLMGGDMFYKADIEITDHERTIQEVSIADVLRQSIVEWLRGMLRNEADTARMAKP